MVRVLVLGAGGRVGSSVVEAAVAAGHEVTAFLRRPPSLQHRIPPDVLSRIKVIQGDVADEQALRQAMRGQDAVVQSAGYLAATYNEGKELQRIVISATQAVVDSLVEGPKRFWVLGGAGALDIPGRPGVMMVDVPGFPKQYSIHKENYRYLVDNASSVDWTMACPGNLFDDPAGRAVVNVSSVQVTVEEAPLRLPSWSACLPTQLLLPAFATAREQLRSASYQDVAAVIAAHLETGGPLRHRRIGLASSSAAGGPAAPAGGAAPVA